MRYLVLSDLHLGDGRAHQDERLLLLLSTGDYDKLILAGDIFDFWLEEDWKEIYHRHPILIEVLRKSCEKHDTIWVRGNHEFYTPECTLHMLLPRAKIVERYVIEGTKQTLIIHGYQIEDYPDVLAKFLCRLNQYFWRWFGLDIQSRLRKTSWYRKSCIEKQNRFTLRNCAGKYSAVVLGHTHLPMRYTTNQNILVVNAGDWVNHASYIDIDDGSIRLVDA